MECVEGIRRVDGGSLSVLGLDPFRQSRELQKRIAGLFFPLELLPPAWQTFAHCLPVTHVVSLLRGIWTHGAWSQHWGDVGALLLTCVVCTALAGKIFRWE
jgi:uncharacterized phage infection (PIP) family protein YhgE